MWHQQESNPESPYEKQMHCALDKDSVSYWRPNISHSLSKLLNITDNAVRLYHNVCQSLGLPILYLTKCTFFKYDPEQANGLSKWLTTIPP
jgi:hypothetical protein